MHNALRQISAKIGTGSEDRGMNGAELRHNILELEGMLQKDKAEFGVCMIYAAKVRDSNVCFCKLSFNSVLIRCSHFY